MPRYFFNRINGSVEQDQDGLEFADVDEARRQAVVFVGETLKEQPFRVGGACDLRVEMTDDLGSILFSVKVSTASAQ